MTPLSDNESVSKKNSTETVELEIKDHSERESRSSKDFSLHQNEQQYVFTIIHKVKPDFK